MDRRTFLASSATLGLGALAYLNGVSLHAAAPRPGYLPILPAAGGLFAFPPLPYGYGDLAPYVDQQTMELHHMKHHNGYVNKLNAALEQYGLTGQPLEALFDRLNDLDPAAQDAIRNNGGGHYNHTRFWQWMTPEVDQPMPPGLVLRLEKDFGSVENFQQAFLAAAGGVFGSGWAWLIIPNGDPQATLQIVTTENQDNPLMADQPVQGLPILGVDVWEHAYYLNYQNQRTTYLQNWMRIVNWERVHQGLED